MVELLACAQCGAPLDPPSGAGRPRTYCSTACRRLAELAIRRLNRRLEYLEGILSHDRIAGSGEGAWCEPPAERRARIGRVSAEVVLIERRLRSLFCDEEK